LRKSKADIVDLKNLIIIESKSLKKESMISKLMAEKAIPEAS
jgi:hypothetical protein